ncbi:hypothetical protein SAMN05518683_11770 [Salibacterium halotolerans]|uniref:Uncharacterized protein n=1 Tax=Salibacterium halotolerans TaxID=1884432 RepID=A0A1I5VVN0_9BACI|nr:hypothetical protein SAMN05518683_11770 [Salibacterium halotolerans]
MTSIILVVVMLYWPVAFLLAVVKLIGTVK